MFITVCWFTNNRNNLNWMIKERCLWSCVS